MISLWYANTGEDFKILKTPKDLIILTSEQIEFNVSTMTGDVISVVGKYDDIICVVFANRRFAFSKEQALKIFGDIIGKTKEPPKIKPAQISCKNDCSKCKLCHK